MKKGQNAETIAVVRERERERELYLNKISFCFDAKNLKEYINVNKRMDYKNSLSFLRAKKDLFAGSV